MLNKRTHREDDVSTAVSVNSINMFPHRDAISILVTHRSLLTAKNKGSIVRYYE